LDFSHSQGVDTIDLDIDSRNFVISSSEAVLRVSLQAERLGARDHSDYEIFDFGNGTELSEDECEDLGMEMANQTERILESAKKGAAKSYRTEGKRERQEEMFPKLQEEIAKKRKELYEPLIWATPEARHSEAFKEALWKACQDKIGGPPEDKVKFFSETIARWPQCFWIDGCAAPMVKNYTIRFRMKPNAKPSREATNPGVSLRRPASRVPCRGGNCTRKVEDD
jgi:hypothetical protein